MKKIGIVTFQRALNYGALLQMYALYKFLGIYFPTYNVEIIDYFSPLCEKECTLRNIKGRNVIIELLKKANFLLKKHRFSKFISSELNISSKYTVDTIKRVGNEYQIIISGSDQVWNPDIILRDMNYLLAFANETKKISYAASIGKNELPVDCIAKYKKQLEQFKAISVREKSAKILVDNLLNAGSSVVSVDPTLLLAPESWEALARKKKNSGYVFLYQVTFSKILLDKAKEFAASKDLKVIYVGPYVKTKGVKYIPAPSISTLLSLFRNANYVFTNSFHGTVFSIQFCRRFWVELLPSDARNNRITDLLEICSLQSHTEISSIEDFVNWEKVQNALKTERSHSIDYLRMAFED